MIARLLVLLAVGWLPLAALAQFDHAHSAWAALLKKHVVLVDAGKASQARYGGFQEDRAQLKQYLETLSKVSAAEFQSWSKPQQLAFLINAYNAAAIEKVLSRYPNIRSTYRANAKGSRRCAHRGGELGSIGTREQGFGSAARPRR